MSKANEIGHIEFRSGQTVHFYLGHNGDYVQAQGPNTGLQSFQELGAAIYWAEQKFGPVKRIENAEDFEMDMFSHFHRRTFSPQDVAEIVGQTPASIRAKAASLAETRGERLAYKNAGGWQITTAGLHEIQGWPDGRTAGERPLRFFLERLRDALGTPGGPDLDESDLVEIGSFQELPHAAVSWLWYETELCKKQRWQCARCQSNWIRIGPAAYQNSNEGDGWVFVGAQLPGECDCLPRMETHPTE